MLCVGRRTSLAPGNSPDQIFNSSLTLAREADWVAANFDNATPANRDTNDETGLSALSAGDNPF